MPLRDGLAKELAALPQNTVWSSDGGIGERMDAFPCRLSAHDKKL